MANLKNFLLRSHHTTVSAKPHSLKGEQKNINKGLKVIHNIFQKLKIKISKLERPKN